MNVRETGAVKWFNVERGYGFIARDKGGDAFVHISAVQGWNPTLAEGQKVEFAVEQGVKGARATNVVMLG